MSKPKQSENIKTFSKNLRFVMCALGISQVTLAKASGLTPSAINQILSGKREPSLGSVVKILNVIPITFERLMKKTIEKENIKIELGREVKCIVTGYKGIATARIEYLNGCFKVHVQPPVKKDGTHPDGLYIDEPQLEYTVNKKKIPGGPKDVGGPTQRHP